jgi:hypothetical protein
MLTACSMGLATHSVVTLKLFKSMNMANMYSPKARLRVDGSRCRHAKKSSICNARRYAMIRKENAFRTSKADSKITCYKFDLGILKEGELLKMYLFFAT